MKKQFAIILVLLLILSALPLTVIAAPVDFNSVKVHYLRGDNPTETGIIVANEMGEKYDTILLGYAHGYPDALTSPFLAIEKNAPILLHCSDYFENCERTLQRNLEFIEHSLAPDGTVYILGGEGVIPRSVEDSISDLGVNVQRIAGANRFESNALTLEEAGLDGGTVLVCTGLDWAPASIASATGLPVLITYTSERFLPMDLLEGNRGNWNFVIVGNEQSVSKDIEEILTEYGTVERLAGSNRKELSLMVAERFFDAPEEIVLVQNEWYAALCAAPLAHAYNAPLFITDTEEDEYLGAYVEKCNIQKITIIGEFTDPSTPHIHYWDAGTVTAPATCTTEGVKTYTCDCGEIKTEAIPVTAHTEVTDAAVAATCTATGLTEGKHCSVCGTVLTAQKVVPVIAHTFTDGTCTVCGTPDPNYVPPTEPAPTEPESTEPAPTEPSEEPPRVAGGNRFETANLVGDQMKANLGIEKFDAVVVASGTDFADALAGSYLAAVKNAPILLSYTTDKINSGVKDYIKANLNEGGTVYILGGEKAVPESFKDGLEEQFTVKRLAGGNRFETNLLVLQEAGVGDKPILVCTGLDFADSLSASAAKLPILLVYGNKLLPDQAAFLEANKGRDLYIIGGDGAVSKDIENLLTAYGTVDRVAGGNRFETSTLIAETFFDKPESAVLAYAWGFPDGLCGGPLAATMNAPLILTMEKYEAKAAEYIQSKGIASGTILGGEKLIPEASVNLIFN